jgi:hypothetical protein
MTERESGYGHYEAAFETERKIFLFTVFFSSTSQPKSLKLSAAWTEMDIKYRFNFTDLKNYSARDPVPLT